MVFTSSSTIYLMVNKCYYARIKKGLCGICGKNPLSSKSLCVECKVKQNQRAKELKAKRISNKMCSECGGRPLHSKYRCLECNNKNNKIISQTTIIRRDKLRAMGLCTNCGKESLFTKDHCKACRDKHVIVSRKSNRKCKQECFLAYGGPKCARCGIEDPDVLTIDHINNNGSEERKQNGLIGGLSSYLYLKRNNYPPGFQVLCFNCNYKKYLLSIK